MYSNSDPQCSLAARKLISTLSSHPEELIRYLNRESSIFSKTADPSVLAALRILKLFYNRIKSEVNSPSDLNANESDIFRFLNSDNDETCQDLINRYAKELSPKHWRELDVNVKTPRRNVPEIIPRFSQNFNDNAESDESSIITKKSSSSDSKGNKKSKRIIEVVESSSSSSSSSIRENVPSSSGKRHSNRTSSNRNLPKQQVDRSCSPIESNLFEVEELSNFVPPPVSQRRSARTEHASISVISMGVQTDAIKVDASTRTHFNNSSLTSTPNSIDETSTSKTSSSLVSSEHSIGQISIQRAAFLTSRSNFRIVTLGRDGSVQPTFNMPNPMDHSTPLRNSGRTTTIRDLTPRELEQDIGTIKISNPISFQQVMGSSSESPLVAQEQSIHSFSGSRTQSSNVIEDLVVNEGISEEDVSTLNQISPLPTG